MISYVDNKDLIKAEQLHGFFVGWKSPLSPERHLELIRGSTYFIAAYCEGRVVGFITALTDGVNSSFIPLFEVLPDFQGCGIGTELFQRMLIKLENIANVDLICDIDMQPFYERFGMLQSQGMVLRK
ncbi:MAG: GNAT family N-acetyltransferase [Defluviitaleaceae bacterium]|nr:GNAT family N-acetyltransferase [Defluviitaleaceae bacterium]